MSIDDEIRAKGALTRYLTEWGVTDAPRMANKFITELVAQGWQMSPIYEIRPQPPRAHEACRVCNRHHDRCICSSGATARPDEIRPPNDEWLAARAQLATPHTPDTEES